METNAAFEQALGTSGAAWARTLRESMVEALPTEQVLEIGSAASSLALGAAVTSLAAATGAAAASQGGTAMTTAITSAGTSAVAKMVGACALAASVAAGGTAAVTGNLPTGAQSVVADVGSHIGLDLPNPRAEAGAGIALTAELTHIVPVGAAGDIEVGLDSGSLVLGHINTSAGYEAAVQVESEGLIVVDFLSASEIVTADVTTVNGEVRADIRTRATIGSRPGEDNAAGGDASAEIQGSVSSSLDAGSLLPLGGLPTLGVLGDGTCGCNEEADEAEPEPTQPEAQPLGVEVDVSAETAAETSGGEPPCGCDESDGTDVEAGVSLEIGIGLGG